jgi:uncharacterized membrane protein
MIEKLTGGNGSMMLGLSLVLGVLPLIGIALTLMDGIITTVDGLFMTLILLALSGVFLLNAYWEMCDCGMIQKKKAAASPSKATAAKAN